MIPNPALLFHAIYRILQRDIRVVAGGVSFFVLLSIFPLASVTAALYGLFGASSPADYEFIGRLVPASAREALVQQLTDLNSTSFTHISIHLLIGIGVGFFSAMSAAKVLIEGIHVVTGRKTAPGIIHYQSLSAFITIVMLLSLVVSSASYIALSNSIGESSELTAHSQLLGLALMIGKLALGSLFLGFLYLTILPAAHKRVFDIVRGALMGGVVWLAILSGFNLFLEHSELGTIYGAISAVIVFLLWIYLSTYALLFGAVIANGDDDDVLNG